MKQYIVDAFTDKVFSGNPAAVCVLDEWLSDSLMMSIAQENNLSETAFMVKLPDGRYHLRWFTPGAEVDLCGHATLASGYTLLRFYEPEADRIVFTTLGGELIVSRKGDAYEMEFPAYDLKPVAVTDAMADAFGKRPSAAYLGRDLLCVFDDEETVRNLTPDMAKLTQIEGLLQHATARGRTDGNDCVSRSFAPKIAINEDPVCGSGHCHIAPYWAGIIGRHTLTAYQASERGGTVYCRVEGNKVFLAGNAALFSIAELVALV